MIIVTHLCLLPSTTLEVSASGCLSLFDTLGSDHGTNTGISSSRMHGCCHLCASVISSTHQYMSLLALCTRHGRAWTGQQVICRISHFCSSQTCFLRSERQNSSPNCGFMSRILMIQPWLWGSLWGVQSQLSSPRYISPSKRARNRSTHLTSRPRPPFFNPASFAFTFTWRLSISSHPSFWLPR